MQSGSVEPPFDVILIGSGLGALAAARGLALHGQRVGFITGVGRSRSLESDGGLVDPDLVEAVFGTGAPLGQVIAHRQDIASERVDISPIPGGIEDMAPRRTYCRFELESWARDRALEAGAVFLEGFVEEQVLPRPDGALTVTDESGGRSVTAGKVALCEGSDPRIAVRAGLRPDYLPEEQIHFARAIIARPQADALFRNGRTRTSWGMPIGFAVVPLGATTLVQVDTRIENVMRGARSTQEALLDLLSSRLGAELGLQGERIHTGIELTTMRSHSKGLQLSQDHLLMGIDGSGMMDAREARRADVTIRCGQQLAAYLHETGDQSWDTFAMPLVTQVKAVDPGWHHSGATGFIEESEGSSWLTDSVSRIGRGILQRFRARP